MTTITVQKGETEYELEVDWAWEDARNGLISWTIESVTILNGPKPEHDLDPTIFTEALNDADIADIESQIKDSRS